MTNEDKNITRSLIVYLREWCHHVQAKISFHISGLILTNQT